MTMMAGRPAVEKTKGGSNVCIPSGFPVYVISPPQPEGVVERSLYKAVW